MPTSDITECKQQLRHYNFMNYMLRKSTRRLIKHAIVGAFALGIAIPTFHSFLFIQNSIYSISSRIAFILAITVATYCGGFLAFYRQSFYRLRDREFEARLLINKLYGIHITKWSENASYF
jgi:putative flippase GtrA